MNELKPLTFAINLLLRIEQEKIKELQSIDFNPNLLEEKISISEAIKCLQFCNKHFINGKEEVIKMPLPKSDWGSLRVYELDEDDSLIDAHKYNIQALDLNFNDLILKRI